jgi:Zn-dependent protease with chaperone function
LSTGARAWASAAMLAGFLAVAALQLAIVAIPVLVLLAMLPGRAALQIGGPLCVATVGVMAYANWRALHHRRTEPTGIPVSRTDAPELWSMIDAAATAAGVRAPQAVIVVADAAATLHQRSHLLGLIGGRRDLYLGFPLIEAWDAARLRAIVAHELAHGTRRLSPIAPLAYRGRVVVGRVVPRIPRNNPAGPLLRAWAGLYRRVDAPFSRAQELTADRIAAEFAGPAAAAAVLRDRPALDALLRIFHTEYVGPGWRAGHVPEDLFGGFLRVLAARAEEMALARTREPATPGPWDTHPPGVERLAALATPKSAAPRADAAASGIASAAAERASAGTTSASGSAGVGSAPSRTSAGGEVADASLSDAGLPGVGRSSVGLSSAGTKSDALLVGAATTDSGTADVASHGGSAIGQPGAGLTAAMADGDAVGVFVASAAAGSAVSGGVGDLPAGASSDSAVGGAGEAVGPRDWAATELPGDRGGFTGVPMDVDLVPDLPGLGRALQAVVFPPQGRTVAGWDEFFGAARTTEMEREADAALGTISRAAGATVTNASEVLDLAADGRLRKAAEAVFPDLAPDETAARIGELVTLLLALAALRAGVGRWRHSWTGSAELVTPDGGHLDLGGLAALAIDPGTVATARDRLSAMGIDLMATGAGERRAAVPTDVVGGLVNLVVDGARTDVLIGDTGLLLVPGLPRSQNGSAKHRLAQMAAAGGPGDAARFVPYAEMTGAAQTRRTPKSWDLRLRDGGTLTVRTALDSDELPGGWSAFDDAIAFLARTRA